MNILVITQLYPQPDDEGANKPTHTVEYFAKEWVKSGNRVVVAHCPSKFPLPFYLIPAPIKNRLAVKTSNIFPNIKSRAKLQREEYGIEIYRYPMLKTLPGRGYSDRAMKRQSELIRKDLERIRFIPDIVIGHFANPSMELVALLQSYYKAKSSIVFHGDCTQRNLERYRIKQFVKDIGAIGTRSQVEAEKVKKLLSLQKQPFVCYSGVPNDAVEQAALECSKHDYQAGIRYLWTGSLIQRKNLNQVMLAFSEASGENDQLTILGSGPDEKSFREYAKGLAGHNRILFQGRVERSEVLRYMKNDHVFTLISDNEVYGMVYIEAMLQGCLVIASQGGGFDGIIRDGINGFLCRPGDSSMLIQVYRKIQHLSIEERNSIGRNAIETARHYSEQEVAERYLDDIIQNQGAYR